jgi:ketosteroid isomerase-like protein
MAAENAEVVRRMSAAFEERDFETLLTFLDPEVEVTEWPEVLDSRTYRGHDGLFAAVESWAEAWEWIHTEIHEIVENGDRVLVRGRTRGKGRGSEVELEMDTFHVYTFRDGKATRITFFTSEEPALRAAGLSEIESKEST